MSSALSVSGSLFSASTRSLTKIDHNAWFRPSARTRSTPSLQAVSSRLTMLKAAHSVSLPEIPASLAFLYVASDFLIAASCELEIVTRKSAGHDYRPLKALEQRQ